MRRIGGSSDYFRAGWLAACGLVLALLAACVPAVEEETASLMSLEPVLGMHEWTAEVMGMPVHYQQVDDFASHGLPHWDPATMNVPIVFMVEEDGTCTLLMHRSFLAGDYRDVHGTNAEQTRWRKVRTLAGIIASCFVNTQLDPDAHIERQESGFPTFTRPWAEVYIDECGLVLQPLGFPLQDGECELPDPYGLLIPLED